MHPSLRRRPQGQHLKTLRIFCSFEPIFTILFSALILGENITAVRIAGMLLLVGAIVIPNYRELIKSKPLNSRLLSSKSH